MKFSEVDELSRTQLEEGADFLGLIIMQNLVKKETYGAITELHAADIVTLMVTGDNIQTAIRCFFDTKIFFFNEKIYLFIKKYLNSKKLIVD